ncbi:uncharacterized protein ACN63O_012379 [Diretmus argenteus]
MAEHSGINNPLSDMLGKWFGVWRAIEKKESPPPYQMPLLASDGLPGRGTESEEEDEVVSGFGHSGVYTIYPAGPTSPIQVYCDMGCVDEPDVGKWTVIQRRKDGTFNFYRGWDQYKTGFGQASGEYWLGLENIHLLTLSQSYELRVDMEDFDGMKVYAQYSSFSVSTEQDGYKLTLSGFTDGGAGLENIHLLTLRKSYELRVDMEDFEGMKVYVRYSSFSVSAEQDGYRLTLSGFTDGGADIRLVHITHYAAPPPLKKFVQPRSEGLYVVFLLVPVAVSSPVYVPVDCADLYSRGFGQSGVYTIYPAGPTSPILVYCDMDEPDVGKWTVIQRRKDGTFNFYRGWDQYKTGFGQASGEYWLGLENIHLLTLRKSYELRVDMEDFEGMKVYVRYSSFSVSAEQDGYRLTLSGFTDGGAGDSMDIHNGQKFSTFDKDQDTSSSNCAKLNLGGWWYGGCQHANPNGQYLWGSSAHGIGINWQTWKGYEYSLKAISMKIRPTQESVTK